MLLYHGFLISTASSVRHPVEFYNAKATIFLRFCSHGVKLHEIGIKSASFFVYIGYFNRLISMKLGIQGILGMLNLNLKPIFVYDEWIFQKFDFYFSSTQPLMRKCKFSTIHKYKYEYFIIWNYDQQIQKQIKKNNFEDTLKNKVFRAILASGGHTTPVWYDTYVKQFGRMKVKVISN